MIEPLSLPHPLHHVLAQGHHSQIGLQITVHPPTQEGIEISSQFPGMPIITAAMNPFPQLQIAFGAEILQQ